MPNTNGGRVGATAYDKFAAAFGLPPTPPQPEP